MSHSAITAVGGGLKGTLPNPLVVSEEASLRLAAQIFAGRTATALGAGSSSFTGGTLTTALNEAPIVTIASASTVAIGAATANSITVSGTTTITGFDSIAAGAVRYILFSGVLTLAHNSTSLILPGSANITTAAGDVAIFVSLGSGNWRCVSYTKASGTPIISGGLVNFTESVSSAAPNNPIPAVRLLATNAATNVDVVFSPKGTGSVLAQLPDNTTAGGNKRGVNSVDLQTVRAINDQVGGSAYSFIGAGQNNKIGGGGSGNNFVGGGDTNTINTNGSLNVIVGGQNNSITGTVTYGGILCGRLNTISANYAQAGGQSCTASATHAVALGNACVADGLYSHSRGRGAISRGMSADAWSVNFFSVAGDAQTRTSVLSALTTDATPAVATTDVTSASGTNQFLLPSGSGLKVRGQVIARNVGTGNCGWWDISGACKNVAGTVSLSGTPSVTAFAGDAAMNTCAVDIVADNTNKCLQVNVTGIASVTIHWVIAITSVEAA